MNSGSIWIDCEDELIEKVIGAAIEVHRILGPGLLESVYERALIIELKLRGISVDQQVEVPVEFKGYDLGLGFRSDVIVEKCLLLELKAIREITDQDIAKTLNYMKLLKFRKGLILNFHCKLLKDGIKRLAI